MKRLLCVVLVLMTVLPLGHSVAAANQEIVVLSELSDEECLAFIKAQGVSIPNIYEEEIQCVPFVRAIIQRVEENPQNNFIFNYHVLEDFANDIQTVVNEYYGTNNVMRLIESKENILEDNALHGEWDDEFVNYRCYSYVLGYDYYVQPGEIDWGKSGGTGTYVYNYDGASVLNIARRVEDDLISLGYTVTVFSTTMPNTQVSSHTHLICARKGTDVFTDYHFMKLGMDGYWYHKPGKTNPLKYLHTPSSDIPWVVEGYYGITGLFTRDPEFQYDSEIYFIEYTTPHTYAYESCGNGQHILTCTICGETTGAASDCVYVNCICTSCGHHNHNMTTTGYTGREYHEGKRHYYEYYSICQDCGEYAYHWESQPCSGPPCEVIMGIVDTEEVIK